MMARRQCGSSQARWFANLLWFFAITLARLCYTVYLVFLKWHGSLVSDGLSHYFWFTPRLWFFAVKVVRSFNGSSPYPGIAQASWVFSIKMARILSGSSGVYGSRSSWLFSSMLARMSYGSSHKPWFANGVVLLKCLGLHLSSGFSPMMRLSYIMGFLTGFGSFPLHGSSHS